MSIASTVQSIDESLLHAVNGGMANAFADVFFAFITEPGYSLLPGIVLIAFLFWKGSPRTRYALVMIILGVVLADLIGAAIKAGVARPRPFVDLPDLRHVPGGPAFNGKSASFPSNHALNNFAAAGLLAWFFPRLIVIIPAFMVASLVAFSRVYTGVHYPSDVLGGALMGLIVAGLFALMDRVQPVLRFDSPADRFPRFNWLGLMLLVLVMASCYRGAFVIKGVFPLAAEEAQYWAWSRMLDLSYYSKPPGIAWLIAATTSLFGNTEFGIRAVSLACSVAMAVVTWILAHRMFGLARITAIALILLNLIILYGLGAIVTTTDTPLMLCWSLACLFAWYAVFERANWGWYAMGAAIAAGMLSKYAMVYFPISLALYLAVSPTHRPLLRSRRWWAAILIGLTGLIPVLIWNMQNDWVSFRHVAGQATAGKGFGIDIGSFFEYFFGQAFIVGPGLFALMMATAVVRFRSEGRLMDPRLLFLLMLGLPVFVGLWLKSLQGKVLGNWAAPAYYTLTLAAAWQFCQWWDEQIPATAGRRWMTAWGVAIVAIPVAALVVFHEPSVYRNISKGAAGIGMPLKPSMAPGYQFVMGRRLGKWVAEQQATMPNPQSTFIVAKRYQEASLLQFYLPGQPRTYNVNTGRRMNQFDVWGGFPLLEGQDALYILNGSGDAKLDNAVVLAGFESVGEARWLEIKSNGVVSHRFTAYPCYGFKGSFPEPEEKSGKAY